MDNSFLVEEAYNQETGVVQHILTLQREVNRQSGSDAQAWHLNFTQEWPVPDQVHQLSFTLPYSFVREQGRWTDGWGDVMLNYRHQLWLNQDRLTALAPRATVILPTGDADRGLGEETLGAQFNLPFSTLLGDVAFCHLNAGLTALPDAASANDRDLVHYHLAGSLIYAISRELHLLVEWAGIWEDGLSTRGHRRHEWKTLISPGVRYAVNLPQDVQIVGGVAVPLGLNGAAPDYGVFLYLSIEHFMWRPR
ncbi:MAG: transporter [Verrucomicrobiota bacterium]|nr:transporter [Limisphaera sp.]MDW8381817.1 transporter [Verrucomicrobiota bacterium]